MIAALATRIRKAALAMRWATERSLPSARHPRMPAAMRWSQDRAAPPPSISVMATSRVLAWANGPRERKQNLMKKAVREGPRQSHWRAGQGPSCEHYVLDF